MQSLSKVQIKASQEIQGCTKITFPGCVKLDEKVAFVLLRQAGERDFSHIHTTREDNFSAALYSLSSPLNY